MDLVLGTETIGSYNRVVQFLVDFRGGTSDVGLSMTFLMLIAMRISEFHNSKK